MDPSAEPRDGRTVRATPRERVLEAVLALADADDQDDAAYRAAWSRLRSAAANWLFPKGIARYGTGPGAGVDSSLQVAASEERGHAETESEHGT